MKLSEFAAQKQAKRDEWEDRHRQHCAAVLSAAEAVPTSTDAYRASHQQQLREALKEQAEGVSPWTAVMFSGLECDDCGVELLVGGLLMSYPAQQEVLCPGCGCRWNAPT